MDFSYLSRAGLLSLPLAALLGLAPAMAQVVVGDLGVGGRVFGPPPVGMVVGGTVTLGGGPGFASPHFFSTGRSWQGGAFWHQPSFAFGSFSPWGVSGWGSPGWGWGSPSWGWGSPGWGWGPRPWGGWPYGGWPYGGWRRPWFRTGPVILPPVVVPAEQFFGPAAAARMLGVDLFGAVPAQLGTIAPDCVDQDRVVPLAPEVIGQRAELARAKREEKPPFVSNAAARQRAAKFMELGDGYFAEAKYVLAYERYKSAVQAAPDLVDPYLRRGQALIAMRSYDLAALTYRHAFKLHPDWSKTAFRLDALYGDRQHDKEDHLDALAAAAEREPTAELMFLVGAQLLYDGQAERSVKFFERAKDLPHRDPLPLRDVAEKGIAERKAPVHAQPAAAPQPAVKKQRRDEPAVF